MKTEEIKTLINNNTLIIWIVEQDKAQLLKMLKEITSEIKKGLLKGLRYTAESELLKALIIGGSKAEQVKKELKLIFYKFN
jgi:Mg-chelatase subunit ChlI